MSTFVLVVHWQLPDDATGDDAQDAIVAMAHKIHAEAPAPAERVTAYTGVSADVIAQAAEVGAVVEQADRIAVRPGDVVTVRLDELAEHATEEQLAEYCAHLRTAFPNNKIVVLGPAATITAVPAEVETGRSTTPTTEG